MFRFATLFLLAAFFCTVLAVPTPSNGTAEASLVKRQYWGRGTWFYVGYGNCGWHSVDTDWVVALALYSTYDGGSHCGRNVRVTANGITQEGTVVDSCPGCGDGDLDMSPAFFQQFAGLDVGVIDVSWDFA